MKLCKDCKNRIDGRHCNKIYIVPVDGRETEGIFCELARAEFYCGAEARYFEGKEIFISPEAVKEMEEIIRQKGHQAVDEMFMGLDNWKVKGKELFEVGKYYKDKKGRIVKCLGESIKTDGWLFEYGDKTTASTDMQGKMESIYYDVLPTPVSPSEKKLHLVVDGYGNALNIMYGEGNLGYIDYDGECHILNTTKRIKTYNQWREEEMRIDDSIKEWRGGKYRIDAWKRLTRLDLKEITYVYHFESCVAQGGCDDPNIIRHKHNNRPVSF